MAEQVAFRLRPEYQGDTLPPIFHYWSNTHLAPRLMKHGIASPEQFYFDAIVAEAAARAHPLRIVSFGSGSGSLEIDLACRLDAAAIRARVTCVDFNAGLLATGRSLAQQRGVAGSMAFLALDCNQLPPMEPHDVIIVNQFFHHVEELEHFCRALAGMLAPDGVLLTSDVIGRNGHQLWPAVQHAVSREWKLLPEAKRHDRYYGKQQREYRQVDHAAYSNEGIRAQDIVACLLAELDFELFLSHGGSIMPFVERRIGFNLDPGESADRNFIGQVDACDAEALANGEYPASNMIAALRHKSRAASGRFDPVSPDEHARLTRLQLQLLGA